MRLYQQKKAGIDRREDISTEGSRYQQNRKIIARKTKISTE